jgi:hypothetical protein
VTPKILSFTLNEQIGFYDGQRRLDPRQCSA